MFKMSRGINFKGGAGWFGQADPLGGWGPVYELAYDEDGVPTPTGRHAIMESGDCWESQRQGVGNIEPEFEITKEQAALLVDMMFHGARFSSPDECLERLGR